MGRRFASRCAGGILIAAAAAVALFVVWPLPATLLDMQGVTSLRVLDRHGVLLRELRSAEGGRSMPLVGGLPPDVVAAFIAAEDHRFGRHPGIDPLAIGRAVGQNLHAGRVVSGASTIPQQLARRLVPRPRTLVGKTGEALWALRLCAHLSRDQLLREYLDRIPLGNGLFGVEAAAQFYFDRPAAKLTLGQAALLAGMAGSPASRDPYRHLDAAVRQQGRVLERMQRFGHIDDAQRQQALATALDLTAPERVFRAPHFVAQLAQALDQRGLGAAVAIETALDAELQRDVENLLAEELAGLAGNRVGQAAAIVVDNASGEVLAYVGSADFFNTETGQNDGVRALRQPGSALKPFAYALALASGYTAASLLSDVETRLATPTGAYVPHNYDRRIHGPIRLRAALASSYNVPAVRLVEQLGAGQLLGLLRRAGFESLTEEASHYGVGLVLGNGDVSLYELARAYRGLARGGVVGPLVEVRVATGADGQPLPLPVELLPRRFVRREAALIVDDILADEQAKAPAFGFDNALRLPFAVAAKTGTSRAHVDNWTIGFTAERTVAVWVGNFDGTPMHRVSGITGAGPLFKRIMLRAMQGIAPAPLVDRGKFETARICPLSGQLIGPECPSTQTEIFVPGTAPTARCTMHSSRLVDGRRVPVLDIGPEYYAWARDEGLPAGPWPGTAGDGPVQARLVAPSDGDEYLIDPGYPVADQSIPVRALVRGALDAIEMRLDDGTRLALRSPFATRVPAQPGRHRVELWLPGAAEPSARAEYVVR